MEDADEPISLEEEPALARFGKPLHPKLRKYERGDLLASTQYDYPVRGQRCLGLGKHVVLLFIEQVDSSYILFCIQPVLSICTG